MSRKFTIQNTLIINDVRFARATAIASRLSSVAVALDKQEKTELSSEVRHLANRYFSAIETGIAKTTGAKKIKEQSGRGLQVDLITVDLRTKKTSVAEVKGSLIQSVLKSVKNTQVLDLKRTSAIELGSAIKIGLLGQKRLTTGYSIDEEGRIVEQVEELTEVEKFVKYYKGDIEKLRTHLKAPSKQTNESLRKIVSAIRNNLETKAQTLILPFNINNKQTAITTLKFTRSFILNEANIEYRAATNTIDITFKYRQAVINEGLKLAANSPEVKKAITNYNINFVRILDKIIKKLPENPSKIRFFARALQDIERTLDGENFSADIIFNRGSVIAYKGILSTIEDRVKTQAINIPLVIDITALVRGRTRLRMRRGGGEPHPAKIYERSGTFRQSIEAYVDFRTNSVSYFYEPYYDKLERYGYQIKDLVEGSIRSVTQQQFNRQFNLVRTNT